MVHQKNEATGETLIEQFHRELRAELEVADDPESVQLRKTHQGRPRLNPLQADIVSVYYDLLPDAQTGMGESYIPHGAIFQYLIHWRGITDRAMQGLYISGVRAIESGKFGAKTELRDRDKKVKSAAKISKG